MINFSERSKKSAITRKKRFGKDVFKKMGRKGGLNGGRPFRDVAGLATRAAKIRHENDLVKLTPYEELESGKSIKQLQKKARRK